VFSFNAWHDAGMGEIVNLRRARKARARDEAAQRAAENRARAGMSKAERAAEAKRKELAARTLDHVRLLPLPKGEGSLS
jgi:hypothetical protein